MNKSLLLTFVLGCLSFSRLAAACSPPYTCDLLVVDDAGAPYPCGEYKSSCGNGEGRCDYLGNMCGDADPAALHCMKPLPADRICGGGSSDSGCSIASHRSSTRTSFSLFVVAAGAIALFVRAGRSRRRKCATAQNVSPSSACAHHDQHVRVNSRPARADRQ